MVMLLAAPVIMRDRRSVVCGGGVGVVACFLMTLCSIGIQVVRSIWRERPMMSAVVLVARVVVVVGLVADCCGGGDSV